MKINSKGQAMVETALILPIILLLLLGMAEFARIFGSYLLLNHTAREGARMAAVGKSDVVITETVNSRAGILNVSDLIVEIIPDDTVRKAGDDVTVNLKYKIVIYTPIISEIIPNPLDMEANVVMRVE